MSTQWKGPGPLTFLVVVAAIFNILACDDARSALVLNEVLYDPEGPDAGREFVEIANNGPFAAACEGLTLERGNGSRPDDWKTVWTGPTGAAIPPGGLYRVGLTGPGPGDPAPDLELQNGPDGVRLLKHGFELDRLGWGNLAHPEYFEGHPAPAVRSGHSLARKADGMDTDDNAADFEEGAPTPGRPNRPRVDWGLEIVSVTPERPRPGDRVLVRLSESNRGTVEGFPPSAEVWDGGRAITVGWEGALAAGGTAEQMIMIDAPPDTGRNLLRARVLSQDEVPENDADSCSMRIGIGPIRITEILARPRENSPEWIEVRANGPDGRTLEGYGLVVRGHAMRLAPRVIGESTRVAVVAEDSLQMRLSYPAIRASEIWSYAGRWQRLRDGERNGAVSDSLRIRAADGTCEEIALPGPAPAQGVSLERVDADLPEGPSAWVPCADPGGSTPTRIGGPAAAGSLADAPISIRPRVVHPGSTACLLEGSVGSAPGEVKLSLWDLNGREVRCLLRGIWASGRVAAAWDGRDESGRDVAPGVYVAILEIARKGMAIKRRRAALAVAPGTGP